MRTKHIGWVLLSLFMLLAAVSCKSTPDTGEEAAPQEITPVDLSNLIAVEERARAARKLVSDFDGPNLFPAEWRAADTLYNNAERSRTVSTAEEAFASAGRYILAAEAFENLSKTLIPHFYELRVAELLEARRLAVLAGAEGLTFDELMKADDAAIDAEEKYQAGDFYGAKSAAANALNMYQILTVGLDAVSLRNEIAQRRLESRDPDLIRRTDDTLDAAVADFMNGDLAAARQKAESAYSSYYQFLNTALQAIAGERRTDAIRERQNALDVRGNVASRNEFNAAQETFNRAERAFTAGNFADATRYYEQSVSQFMDTIRLTALRRAEAEAAMELANQRMAESDEAARQAEIILEGGLE